MGVTKALEQTGPCTNEYHSYSWEFLKDKNFKISMNFHFRPILGKNLDIWL